MVQEGRRQDRPEKLCGYSFPRATYASDKVGFFEMQTLYDTCQRFDNIEYLNEWFATSIIHDGKKFMGITAIERHRARFTPSGPRR